MQARFHCLVILAMLSAGCLAPVVPERARVPPAARSSDWATSDPDALETLAFEPKSDQSGPDLGTILLVGLALGAAILNDREAEFHGRVIWSDGVGCSECHVEMKLEHDDEQFWTKPVSCNENGFFSITVTGAPANWEVSQFAVTSTIGDTTHRLTVVNVEGPTNDIVITVQ